MNIMLRVGIVFLVLTLFAPLTADAESQGIVRKESGDVNASHGSEEPVPVKERGYPNIFLIVIDALRPDHLGCYGYERNTSPNIDNLAGEGVLFEHAVSQTPVTTFSVTSFLTGSYVPSQLICSIDQAFRPLSGQATEQSYLTVLNKRLSEEIKKRGLVFLPEVVEEKGYKTAAFIANPFACSFWGEEMGFDRASGNLFKVFGT